MADYCKKNQGTIALHYFFTWRETENANLNLTTPDRTMLFAFIQQLAKASSTSELEKILRDQSVDVPTPKLIAAIGSIAQLRYSRMYIIADGLDECPRGEVRRQCLDVLEKIYNLSVGSTRISLLIFSRWARDIKLRVTLLHGLAKVINKKDTQSDVRRLGGVIAAEVARSTDESTSLQRLQDVEDAVQNMIPNQCAGS
jgi:hypothetical protein